MEMRPGTIPRRSYSLLKNEKLGISLAHAGEEVIYQSELAPQNTCIAGFSARYG